MHIVGLAGISGVGKDTVARMIPDSVCIAFADPIKEAVYTMFAHRGITRDHLWGPSHLRDTLVPDLAGPQGPITVRYLLQSLGTAWGREMCNENIWVDIAREKVYALPHTTEYVVLTDVRMQNEVIGVSSMGGRVWHVKRPDAGLEGDAAQHRSETELTAEILDLCTATVDNSGTLEDLRVQVGTLVAGLE